MSLYTVTFSASACQTQLLFKHEDHARAAFAKLKASDRGENDFEIEVIDDFGTEVLVNRDEMVSVCFQDLARNHEGQAETQLAAARATAALQNRAARDPALALAGGVPRPPGFQM